MSKVIDFAAARAKKAGRVLPPGWKSERLPLIACGGCNNSIFSLAHDGRVICTTCCFEITPLRWIDITVPKP